jgi:8-oxo-dGTP diphosphatase
MSELPTTVLVNRAVIRDGERLLLLQRSKDDSYHPGLWELPGGKADAGEELIAGLQREVLEETGLTVEPESTFAHIETELIHTGKYAGRLYLGMFHAVRRLYGEVAISFEHDAYKWVHSKEVLQHDLTPECRSALTAFAKETSL